MPRTPPYKLLIFAHSLQGRGTEKSVVRLLKEFDRTILTPMLALASVRGEFLHEIPGDVPIHDLHIGMARTSAALPRLDRLIRRVRPDCVLGVHISAGRALSILRLLHPTLPVICMESDPFTRIEGGKGHLGLRTAVSRVTYRLASRVVAASEVVVQDLVDHLRIDPRKIDLIPLASVDDDIPCLAAEPLLSAPFDAPKNDPIIVAIGNMHPHKDQGTLLRGFELVQRTRPAQLVLLGDGPSRPHLEQLAQQLGVSERVWFMGFQNNPYKYLSRSQVFVSSSIAEGFDISQIEAMACGLPVIVTDAPRFRAVTNGETGLTIPPGNPEALAAAVLRILDSDTLASYLGRNASEAAKAFSAQLVARRYEAMITSLMQDQTLRSPK